MSLPKYKHFCLDCVFLGNSKPLGEEKTVDLYYCMSQSHQTFVVRHGDSDNDFQASLMKVKDSINQTKDLSNALGDKPNFKELIDLTLDEQADDYMFIKALEKAYMLNLIDENFIMKPLTTSVKLPLVFSGEMLPTFRFEDSNVGVIDVSFKVSTEIKSVVLFFRPNNGKPVIYEKDLYAYVKDIDSYFRSFPDSSFNINSLVDFFAGGNFGVEMVFWLGLKAGLEAGVFTKEELTSY